MPRLSRAEYRHDARESSEAQGRVAVNLFVVGVAQPQGSKTGFAFKRKNGTIGVNLVEGRRGPARANFHAWRDAVSRAAADWMRSNEYAAPLSGPVSLIVEFYLPRPAAAKKRLYPTTRPDLDKLVRAVGDALKGIAYVDDSQIVEKQARKRYAVDVVPHAEIWVEPFA